MVEPKCVSRTPPLMRQPTGELVLILQKQRFHISPNHFALAQRRIAAIAGDNAEELIVACPEYLEPGPSVVFAVIDGQ